VTVAYTRGGAGEPLLLIHGLGGIGAYWEPLLPQLTDRYDVVAIDLPGFGGSSQLPGSAVHPEALAGAVAVLLDDLEWKQPNVVGHSLGGYVALELAALGRARTVTGLAPAGLWAGQRQAGFSRARLRATHFVASVSRPVARPFVQLACRAPFARLPKGISVNTAVALYDSYATSPGFGAVLKGVEGSPFTKGAQLTMPVTVVFGTRDTVILHSDQSRDRLPAHTRWEELDGTGHNVPWDRASDIIRIIHETTGGLHG
jgi:pimeloyl-ACP methyl ester carboxylesterase